MTERAGAGIVEVEGSHVIMISAAAGGHRRHRDGGPGRRWLAPVDDEGHGTHVVAACPLRDGPAERSCGCRPRRCLSWRKCEARLNALPQFVEFTVPTGRSPVRPWKPTEARREQKERAVRGAGVRRFGGPVEVLEVPGPRGLRPDEVLIDVQACGVGNWDEFARTGDWDLGARPPTALGVEAAGLVAAVGDLVAGITRGDRVTGHSAPLREQVPGPSSISPPPGRWPSRRRECRSMPLRRCRSRRSPLIR